MITRARIFKSNGMIEIGYSDGKNRWARISDGIDTYDNLYPEENESEKLFLRRVKNFAWEKYLKPTESRFGSLAD